MSPSRSLGRTLAIHNVALGLGLCASSFLFWGNVALAEMGVMHMVKAKYRERLGIRPAQALQLWETFFDRGLSSFLPSGIGASVAFLVAAYCADRSAAAVRALLYTASAFSISIAPFTGIFIVPTNDRLKAILRSAEFRSKLGPSASELGSAEEKSRVLEGLDTWRRRSAIRTSLAGAGWVTAVVALLLR